MSGVRSPHLPPFPLGCGPRSNFGRPAPPVPFSSRGAPAGCGFVTSELPGTSSNPEDCMHLAVWRARRNGRRPAASVSLAETASVFDREAGRMTIYFRLGASDAAALEALREVRRAMIQEEWAPGLPPGEPPFAEAEFSAYGVHWEIAIGEQAASRKKIQPLVARANRRLEDASSAPAF